MWPNPSVQIKNSFINEVFSDYDSSPNLSKSKTTKLQTKKLSKVLKPTKSTIILKPISQNLTKISKNDLLNDLNLNYKKTCDKNVNKKRNDKENMSSSNGEVNGKPLSKVHLGGTFIYLPEFSQFIEDSLNDEGKF